MNEHKIPAEQVMIPVLAVITAMIIGGIMIALTGSDPFLAYKALFKGAFGNPQDIALTIIRSTPLILTGLAVAIPFQAGLFNIGGQGQFVLGMICAGFVGIHLSGLPQMLHFPLAVLAAALGGMLWASIAAMLKSWRGAHEVITTIMLSQIAIRLGEFFLNKGQLLQDGTDNPQSPPITPSAGFPILWSGGPINKVHFGLVIALVMAALAYFVINKTTVGYRIRAVGLNPSGAEYGGISISRTYLVALAFGGACAGLAGASFVLGDQGRLAQSDFAVIQYGFSGIAVSLLGRNNPIGVIFAALLFGAMDAGAINVQFEGGLPGGVATTLILVIQGVIVFFIGVDVLFRQSISKVLVGSRRGAL